MDLFFSCESVWIFCLDLFIPSAALFIFSFVVHSIIFFLHGIVPAWLTFLEREKFNLQKYSLVNNKTQVWQWVFFPKNTCMLLGFFCVTDLSRLVRICKTRYSSGKIYCILADIAADDLQLIIISLNLNLTGPARKIVLCIVP